jgi:pimeloyl-ACP methyl ester carboxylesterase
VLLLIHGIGDSSDTWRDIIPQLAKHYTVIAPDLLGHGRSDKPRADYSIAAYANAMRDLLSVLGVERVTVVGHSLGGGVAMQFLYQFPELCERLVLVSSGGVCSDVNALLRLAAAPNAELVLPLFGLASTRAFVHWFCKLSRHWGSDISVDADDLLRVLDTLPDLTARRAFLRTLRSVVDWSGQAVTMLDRCYLAGHVPTLLIWGSRDAVIPARHAEIANMAVPGSHLEIFEGAGHFPFRTDPDRFVSVLERFLMQTEPAEYVADDWRERLRRGPPNRRPVDTSELNCERAGSCGAWCVHMPPEATACHS